MVNATSVIFADREGLVKCVAEELADVLVEPATEALGAGPGKRIRERVLRLVQAGRVDAARALVDDEIRLWIVQREASDHLRECPQCMPGLTCIAYARLERREAQLMALVANAGGLR